MLRRDAPPEHAPVRKVTVIGGTATIKVVTRSDAIGMSRCSINDTSLASMPRRAHDASPNTVLRSTTSSRSATAIKDLQTGGIRFDKQTYFPPGETPTAPSRSPARPSSRSPSPISTSTAPICDALAKLDGVEVQGIEYAYSKQSDIRRRGASSRRYPMPTTRQAISPRPPIAPSKRTTRYCRKFRRWPPYR